MMMPANYSAIAENEISYVNGGSIVDCLPSLMDASNWKKFNTNMITLIANYTAGSFVKGTVATLFDGNYSFGDVTMSVVDLFDADSTSYNGVLNGVLAIVGGLANIYTLGTTTAGSIYATSYYPYSYASTIAAVTGNH